MACVKNVNFFLEDINLFTKEAKMSIFFVKTGRTRVDHCCYDTMLTVFSLLYSRTEVKTKVRTEVRTEVKTEVKLRRNEFYFNDENIFDSADMLQV